MRSNYLKYTIQEIRKKLLSALMTSLVIFFLAGNRVNGQHTVDLTAGISFPELINTGIRAQLNQVQIGFSIGSFPASDKTFFTLTGDVYYHFAGHSSLSNRRLSFVKAFLNYYDYENTAEKDVITSFGIGIGRDIYFSHRVGITLDGGVNFVLNENKVQKNPVDNSWIKEDSILPMFLPCLEIVLFYRI
jgi:hypothetical protein